MEDHDCLEHLVYRECDSVETHGLDCGPFERFHQEWWECTICENWFTGPELDQLTSEALEL